MASRPYRILTLALAALAAAWAVGGPAPARAQTTDAILDSLHAGAFRYAWYQANPANGLIRDRSQSGSPASIAAVGFGLSAICTGVDHGWVSRADARTRVLTTLNTFWTLPQNNLPADGSGNGTQIGHRGWFYHFLNMNTGFRMWESELSTIDTALLLAGILEAKQYFDGAHADEVQIRALADSIYRRVDFPFMVNPTGKGIRHGWYPADPPPGPPSGYINIDWVGYNEAMILYILAFGSPTKPVPLADVPTSWARWTSGYSRQTHYGYTFVTFPPLFGHQYSHCWIDFRYINDAKMANWGLNYFENSRRATLAQRAYAVANPEFHVGYSDTLWGLSASDGPEGYNARGTPPEMNDNGTITPTAFISSLPFAPEAVLPTIRSVYLNYKPYLWSAYGFRDAFNLGAGWWGPDVLGIDQGPIAIMIENYRTGKVWERFMRNPEVKDGLRRAGFTGPPLAVDFSPSRGAGGVELLPATPNPARDRTTLHWRLAAPGRVRITLFDVAGREVARPVDARFDAGTHQATLATHGLRPGVYRCRLEANGLVSSRPIAVLR
jgi:hypothetical protein